LDWIAAVEEVLDFKGVPEDRRVSLVATKFRGRAAAWWQQLKQSKTRLGKSKINRWEKLLKHMRPAFLPYNYTQTMYQQLQNLSQGSKTVDEYMEEFYKYLTRVELAETDDQLVSQYIGGLRQNIQDPLNLFYPVNVSAAHQRALLLEKTAANGSTGFFGHGTKGNTTRYNRLFTP
jgi:ADP-heptose:LPS heptosyltransferase